MSNKTVGRVEPRTRAITGGGGNVAVYEEFIPFATAGDGTVPIISSSRRTDTSDGLNATCGATNDKRCIGVCYGDKTFDTDTDHNGMTKNPQIQSQVLQILKFADGLTPLNTSFEDQANPCHLPPNNFSPQTQVESHYLAMTGIRNVSITDLQGNTNQSISTAYKLKVPQILETIMGNSSKQIIMPIDNTYTLRFTGNGQPTAIENIRGVTNELSDATYIVRYDDFVIQNGVVAEIKIINNQVDSLKYDANGDGIPETIIPPSRVIVNPQTEDLQAPQVTVSWQRRNQNQRGTITATDNASGVNRIMYRGCYSGGCSGNFQIVNSSSVSFLLSGSFLSGIEVIAEDNVENRTNVIYFSRPSE